MRLTRISDYFSDEHIGSIAQQLHNLEDLYIGGYGVSDAVFKHLTTLKSLKVVNFSGITAFTEDGILEFVNSLGEVRLSPFMGRKTAANLATTSLSNPLRSHSRSILKCELKVFDPWKFFAI